FFLNNEKIEDLSQKKWRYKLFASRQEKTKYLSKFNQLILFFFWLESRYFTRLNLESFPKEYSSSIQRILRSEERRVGKECRFSRDWSSDVCSSDLSFSITKKSKIYLKRNGGTNYSRPDKRKENTSANSISLFYSFSG